MVWVVLDSFDLLFELLHISEWCSSVLIMAVFYHPTSLIFDFFSVMVASSFWLFLSSVCYMPHPFHFPNFYYPNNICHRIQISKVLIMQYFLLCSCHVVPICPDMPLSTRSESHTACVLPLIWEIKFHTHTKPKEKLYIFIAYVSWLTKRQTYMNKN
jgi:hypothetical protein